MRIAIQGEKGSFSYEAALRFGAAPNRIYPCKYSSEVFERVAAGYGAVVPIENSLAGSVLEHYDLLLENPVGIQAELLLRIRHCLVAAPGVALAEVHEVYSHPVALAQCQRFLTAHPFLRAMPFYDTAGSVAHAVLTGGHVAGIGSEHAATTYGGTILAAAIEDHPANYTRFFLLGPPTAPANALEQPNKVSIAFAVPNRSGSLVSALEVFARYRLNLTRLESRPVPGSPWEYIFYADYQLETVEQAERALAELASLCSFVKELGRYRAASNTL